MSRYPDYNIRPVIKYMNFIFSLIWLILVPISIDDMVMMFKGDHYDKNHIMYKSGGDGFQSDALFQCSLTYHIFMRNDTPPPPKCMDKYPPPPLHARLMALFDFLKNMHNFCTIKYIYKGIDAIFIYPTYIHICMFKILLNPFICYFGGG